MYTYGGAIDPRFGAKGLTKKLWALGIAYTRTAGYKTLYSRSTNRITTQLLLEFGGKVLKTVHITEPGVKG